MARRPRLILEGQAHHIVQRGHNRDPVFFDETDYETYREALGGAASRYGCSIHAYCLMTNHVHLLVTPQTAIGLSRMMQMTGRLYVRAVNKKYNRSGTLWEDRFKASLIDSEHYLLTCMRYIELNPVRARMTQRPEDYPWSSFRRNACGEPDAIVISAAEYVARGPDSAGRQESYRALFGQALGEDTVAAIRKAAEGSWVLGNDIFREKIERVTRKPTAPRPRFGRADRDLFQSG